MEHHAFFRLKGPVKAHNTRQNFFRMGSRFRYRCCLIFTFNTFIFKFHFPLVIIVDALNTKQLKQIGLEEAYSLKDVQVNGTLVANHMSFAKDSSEIELLKKYQSKALLLLQQILLLTLLQCLQKLNKCTKVLPKLIKI